MSAILKERIKRCLYCPICHKTLRLFFSTNNIWYRPSKDISLSEGDSKVIKRLGNLLQINGSIEEQWKTLYNLTLHPKAKVKDEREKEDSREGETDCLNTLNRILFELRPLYPVSNRSDLSQLGYNIMNEISNIISSAGTENGLDVKGLRGQFKYYCQLNTKDMPKLQYRYCSQTYQNVLKDTDIKKLRDCQAAYFLDVSKQLPSGKDETEFINAMFSVGSETPFWEICENYLRYAPKHFGRNLELVMERQGMSVNDISSIMEEKSPNGITALCECKTPKRDKEYIHRLAKCLLVSDEVLISGTGKSYGAWKNVLSEEGLNAIKEHEENQTLRSAKKSARDKIRAWSSLSDYDFENLITDNPQFFAEQPFCAYDMESDEEDSIAESMRKNLLHPEEFDLLVQILLDYNRKRQ